jgi:Tol biopolymer transport system component
MSEPLDVRCLLQEAEVPGASAASARAWPAVEAAFAARRRRTRRSHARAAVVAVAAVLLGAAVAAASTPPGVAVRGWVAAVLGTAAPPAPRSALGPLPSGRMLITSSRGAWIVGRDGSRRLLGAYAGASWSPRGLYVAAWRGAELRAVAPDGRVAWGLRTPGRIAEAHWSPNGFRIAYRRAGGLGVVAGDGTGAAALAARVRPAGPAWRPGSPETLAWVDLRGRIVVRDVGRGQTTWRSAASVGRPRELLWSADGEMLLVRSADGVRVASPAARRVWRLRLNAGERVVAAAWAPRGRRLALVVAASAGRVTRVLVGPGGPRTPTRQVFATTGHLASPAWSPDARRILVRWTQADEWLLLPPDGRGRIVAIAPVARRFGGTPTVQGWCCARRAG